MPCQEFCRMSFGLNIFGEPSCSAPTITLLWGLVFNIVKLSPCRMWQLEETGLFKSWRQWLCEKKSQTAESETLGVLCSSFLQGGKCCRDSESSLQEDSCGPGQHFRACGALGVCWWSDFSMARWVQWNDSVNWHFHFLKFISESSHFWIPGHPGVA